MVVNAAYPLRATISTLITRLGDKTNPRAKGYTYEKPARLDHYQNHADRLSSPLRRRDDGRFEPVSWDTAIDEIAGRLAEICDTHGGDKIMYYGGGGQGNHLGGRPEPDFEHAEVSVFVGKNTWQSHGIARARVVLREIHKDPNRKMIVMDPRRTETADLADIFLQVRPGTDAFVFAAMLAVLTQSDLIDREFLSTHAGDGEPLFDAPAALIWGLAQSLVMEESQAVRGAGFAGEGAALGNAIFRAILDNPQGVVIAKESYEETFDRIHTDDGRLSLVTPELTEELLGLVDEVPPQDDAYPFVLAAGERRTSTANTLYRDRIAGTPWHKHVRARVEVIA